MTRWEVTTSTRAVSVDAENIAIDGEGLLICYNGEAVKDGTGIPMDRTVAMFSDWDNVRQVTA